MSFNTSKYNMPSYSGSGCANSKEYAILTLTELKTNILSASALWTLESDIEPLVSEYSGTAGIHTMQFTNGSIHFRVWSFVGNLSSTFINSPDTNTNSSIKIYTGNLFKINYSSQSGYYAFGDTAFLYFAVSEDIIDKDPAKDLQLLIPMFGLISGYYNSSNWLCYDNNEDTYRYGSTITVITDGSMLSLIVYTNGYAKALMFAPDMFVNANISDSNTAGAIVMSSSSQHFSFGDNNGNNNYTFAVFSDASGGFDFDGLVQGCDTGKKQLATTESSTKMVTGPVCYYMYPYTYSGSNQSAVASGIGIKGWLNTNYIRNANADILTNLQRGSTFANGDWICISRGTLLRWDGSNVSPFEPAI